MKPKKAEIALQHPRDGRPIPIVSDGMITTQGLHGGKGLPVLLLDTSDRADVAEFIRVHEKLGPGDFEFQWGQIEEHEGTVAVFIKCIRPMQLFFVLEFNIVKQGILVEQALTGEGIYLMKAKGPDVRLSANFEEPKVIFQIGDTGFRKVWDELFPKHLIAHYRKNGLSRQQAREAARSLVEDLRKITVLRMPDITG
jgi:hypothetical protein